MNNHAEMPTLTFGEDTDYDTIHSIITGWCAEITLSNGDVIPAALWRGWGEGNNTTALLLWSEEQQDYCEKAVINTDEIVRINIL